MKLESLEIQSETGTVIGDEITLSKVGESVKLYALTEPCYVSDFTIELSHNLEMLSPFTIRAIAEGEGFIKITKDSEVIRQITVKIG